ncbi:MAG: argininosuccinate lyase [Proteobacteria bacterium]|nr:argininosuccinate lyase [Pseudomonadota bacterium]
MTDARLGKPPAERLLEYVHGPRLIEEKKAFYEYNDIDLAHTVMLVEQEVLSEEDGKAILEGLKEMRELGPDKFPTDPVIGSFLLQVEDYLFSKIGEDIGGKMHTGRSRIDQGATVVRLKCRKGCLNVMDLLLKLQTTMLELAKQHVGTLTIFRTHLQHAQPSTFGHFLVSYLYTFNHDFNRLRDAYARINLNPLGTAASVGTSWPLSRSRTTELLGFNDIEVPARRGYAVYDFVAECISAITIDLANLYDLATDLYLDSTYEFRTAEAGAEYCGSSSIMPQKKNPYGLEAVRRITGTAIGYLPSTLAQLRGCGTGDAMRGVSIMYSVFDRTTVALDLMQGIMETLTVHKDRMKELAGSCWATASNLADTIVRVKGISFRQAHHVVARLVKNCIEINVSQHDVTSEMVDRAALETIGIELSLDAETIKQALDPEDFVNTRVTEGSCNPREVERMIEDMTHMLEQEEGWISKQSQQIDQSHTKLDEAIERILK